MDVRRAGAGDLPLLAFLRGSFFAEVTGKESPGPFPFGEGREGRESDLFAALAWEGGAACGYVAAFREPPSPGRPRWQLDSLYVVPAHRRRGVGGKLLAFLGEGAKAEGASSLFYLDPRGSRETADFLGKGGWEFRREVCLLAARDLAALGRAEAPGEVSLRAYRQPQDAPPVAELYNEAFRENWDFRHHAPRDVEAWFGRPDYRPGDCLLAEAAGVLVGFAVLAVDEERARRERAGYVPDIGVARAFRGRGLGRALLAALARRALDRGLERLDLIADAADAGALDFYAKAGFEVMGRLWAYELSLP